MSHRRAHKSAASVISVEACAECSATVWMHANDGFPVAKAWVSLHHIQQLLSHADLRIRASCMQSRSVSG
jgi:hypothetical protein